MRSGWATAALSPSAQRPPGAARATRTYPHPPREPGAAVLHAEGQISARASTPPRPCPNTPRINAASTCGMPRAAPAINARVQWTITRRAIPPLPAWCAAHASAVNNSSIRPAIMTRIFTDGSRVDGSRERNFALNPIRLCGGAFRGCRSSRIKLDSPNSAIATSFAASVSRFVSAGSSAGCRREKVTLVNRQKQPTTLAMQLPHPRVHQPP